MISGLIHVARRADPDTVDGLADTLASLVPGVAAGLIGDAVIVSVHASDAFETIAEGSGAALVLAAGTANPWSAGAAAARRDWVLCLEAGDVLCEGWIRSLDRFLGAARADVGLGRLRRPHARLSDRIAARAERVFGARHPRAGDLVRRARIVAVDSVTPRLKPVRLLARLDRA